MAFPILGTPKPQFFTSSGAPLASGTLTIVEPSTDVNKATYPTYDDAEALTNANDNPLTLDARGEPATGLWGLDGEDYKITLKDSFGTTVWTQDDIFMPTFGTTVWTQDDIFMPIEGFAITAEEASVSVTPTDLLYPVGNVKRYGAVGDGSTDDTTAIKNCIAVVNATKESGNTGDWGVQSKTTGHAPAVVFPAGLYKITDSLTSATSLAGTDYMRYVGEGTATLVDTTELVTCFDKISWDVGFEGLKFRGFDTHIGIDTNNVNRAIFNIRDCWFIDPATNCITTTAAGDSASTILNIDNCNFSTDQTAAIALDVSVNQCNINECWFQTDSDVTIINRDTLNLTNCIMVPAGTNTGRYWVQNRGEHCYLKDSRFGSEGGGRVLVYHYTDIDATVPITPVYLIIEDLFAFANGELIRLYGLPNVLKIENLMDDTPTTSSDGIWADSALTAQEIKDWAREGVVDIDPRMGRVRVINNTTVAEMMTVKNLKSHPVTNITTRIDETLVLSSGDTAFGDWGGSTTCAEAGSTNLYGATTDTFTANSTDDNVVHNDTDFLVRGDLSKAPHTLVEEITWTPASSLGQMELVVDVGYERYFIDLLPGTHMYSFPFVYLNGGGAGDDADLDMIQFQTGSRMANGDFIEFGRWYLLDGVHFMGGINLEMIGSAAPSAIAGTTGSNQAYYPGDIVWDVTPAAGAKMHICTVEGDPGTWITE
jgi:hypothetical protein